MMNLREQLKEILPTILPVEPEESVKGTQLIELVKMRLRQTYSEATLRYHFSIMSCDPLSPIAKVEHGQGYYLRTAFPTPTDENQPEFNRNLFEDAETLAARRHLPYRTEKFKAIFQRLHLNDARRVYSFPALNHQENEAETWWQPEAALVDLHEGVATDDDTSLLLRNLKETMGAPPMRITSVRFCLNVSFSNYRREFFRALSAGEWAQGMELVIAGAVTDGQLANDMRKLGLRYGVGVSSYGMNFDALDEMDEPEAILAMKDREMETFQETLRIEKLSPPRFRNSLDWEELARRCHDSVGFAGMLRWLNDETKELGVRS